MILPYISLQIPSQFSPIMVLDLNYEAGKSGFKMWTIYIDDVLYRFFKWAFAALNNVFVY